jgi:ATP-dependent RNA helicase DeaD
MNKPLEISVGKRNSGAENIEHKFFVVHAKDRYKALRRIIDVNPGIYGIIFCRTRHETKDLANKLMQEGYNVDALHGDLSQSQRDYAMQRFRLKNLNLLIATDVAARGIDVSELTHVINYNLPDDPEVYIHRTGRTGRAGKKGVAYSILHSRETGRIKDIERLVGKSFDREMVPDGRMICERHLFDMIDRVGHEVPTDDQVEQYMEIIYDRLEWLDKKELIKRFVSVEFNRFFKEYSDAPDLNVNLKKLENDNYLGKNAGKNSQKGFDRYFINLGEKDKLKPVDIIGLVNQSLKERKIKVGRIDIMKKFAFFELEKGFADKIPPKMSRLNYHGTPISCQVAKPDGKSAKRTSSGKSQRKKSKKARR